MFCHISRPEIVPQIGQLYGFFPQKSDKTSFFSFGHFYHTSPEVWLFLDIALLRVIKQQRFHRLTRVQFHVLLADLCLVKGTVCAFMEITAKVAMQFLC